MELQTSEKLGDDEKSQSGNDIIIIGSDAQSDTDPHEEAFLMAFTPCLSGIYDTV